MSQEHTRQALEEALVDNPDDRAAHAAYADLLMEAGEPRGEFIQVQLALEGPNCPPHERQRLQQREQELLAAHQRDWLGELPLTGADVRFARGWLDRTATQDLDEPLATALAHAPQIRLLREMVIEGDHYIKAPSRSDSWGPALRRHWQATDILARSPYLGNVRVLRLGEMVEDDSEDCPYYDSHWETPAAPDLVARMPRLEELYLLTKRYEPARLFGLWTLHQLRILQVYHLEERYPLEVLADNPHLGNLTHLLLHPHGYADPDAPFLDLAGVRAVLRSPHLRSLTHLQVRLCDMGDEGCREIVDSGILKRLKRLDLRHGCITDDGARLLADCPDLRRLELLDVNRNGLTAAGIEALEATGIKVRCRNQLSPGELARSEYLEEGDFE
jgi:uncharacterized protein (TIGR02996 family)